MGIPTNERDRGVTVLSLLLVVGGLVLVIGAVGFGLGAKRSVGDETAKRAARSAGTAASMHLAETGKVPTAEELAAYSPGLEYEQLDVGEAVAVQGKVYVRSSGDVSELAARSGDTCFWVQRTATTATRYAQGACDGDPASLVFTESW